MNLPRYLLLMICLSLIGGCASSGGNADFSRKIDQVQAGTPKSVVQRELGKPDEKKLGVAGVQATGPTPPKTMAAGARYEQWTYRREGTEYHVFLGPSIERPGTWEVHAVSANPIRASALQK